MTRSSVGWRAFKRHGRVRQTSWSSASKLSVARRNFFSCVERVQRRSLRVRRCSSARRAWRVECQASSVDCPVLRVVRRALNIVLPACRGLNYLFRTSIIARRLSWEESRVYHVECHSLHVDVRYAAPDIAPIMPSRRTGLDIAFILPFLTPQRQVSPHNAIC